MNRFIRAMYCLWVLVIVFSCTTVDLVNLESNRDNSSSIIKDKLVIVSEEDKDVKLVVGDIEKKETTLSHVFGERLKDYLISQGIDAFLIEPSALSLDENETVKEIMVYKSNYALEYKRTGQIANVTTIPGYAKTVGTPGQPGYSTTYIPGSVSTEITYYYEIKIFDTDTKKNIWRSKVSIKGPVRMDTVDELIHDVLRLLVDDKMLDLSIDMLPIYKPKKVLSTGGQFILGVAISIPLLIYALDY